MRKAKARTPLIVCFALWSAFGADEAPSHALTCPQLFSEWYYSDCNEAITDCNSCLPIWNSVPGYYIIYPGANEALFCSQPPGQEWVGVGVNGIQTGGLLFALCGGGPTIDLAVSASLVSQVGSLTDSAEVGPLQLSKAAVLRTVDSVVLHTVPNLKIPTRKHAFQIRILPSLDRDDRGLYQVTSVTQGTQGSVEIARDGSLIYKPNSTQDLPDQFTVTLTDVEGDSVAKTVSLLAPRHGFNDED